MANQVPGSAKRNGGWQLLGEIKINKVDNNVRQLTEQISEVVQELKIQPSQQDRIFNAVLEAIQKTSFMRNRAKEFSQILLHIWVANDCVCGRGWGFFVVEQPFSHSQDIAELTMYLVELFLYQE